MRLSRSILPVAARVAKPVTIRRKSEIWKRCSISGGADEGGDAGRGEPGWIRRGHGGVKYRGVAGRRHVTGVPGGDGARVGMQVKDKVNCPLKPKTGLNGPPGRICETRQMWGACTLSFGLGSAGVFLRAEMKDQKGRGSIESGRTSVLRDETPPIPPGPEGSNGNGPFRAQ